MANSVLLQAGAYSKFTAPQNIQNTGQMYNLLLTLITNADKQTIENIKALYDAWNNFIAAEYPDEVDEWKLDFEQTSTTQKSELKEDGTIDYSQWVQNEEETAASLAYRIQKAKEDLLQLSDDIYSGKLANNG